MGDAVGDLSPLFAADVDVDADVDGGFPLPKVCIRCICWLLGARGTGPLICAVVILPWCGGCRLLLLLLLPVACVFDTRGDLASLLLLFILLILLMLLFPARTCEEPLARFALDALAAGSMSWANGWAGRWRVPVRSDGEDRDACRSEGVSKLVRPASRLPFSFSFSFFISFPFSFFFPSCFTFSLPWSLSFPYPLQIPPIRDPFSRLSLPSRSRSRLLLVLSLSRSLSRSRSRSRSL